MLKMLSKIRRIIKLGLHSLIEHKLRSFLTALGVIFGVGSVIAMLAIGEGASYEAREQIRTMGSANIIIRSVKPPNTGGASRGALVTYGLTYEDLLRIRDLYPQIQIHVPAREINMRLRYKDMLAPGKIIGTVPWAMTRSAMQLKAGRFLDEYDLKGSENAAVITEATARRLFVLEYPVGKNFYIGKEAYQVVGVIGTPSAKGKGDGEEAGGKDGAAAKEFFEVYIPITAATRRFGQIIVSNESGSRTMEKVELHRLTLTAPSEDAVPALAASVRATLQQAHKTVDYELTVPLELLKQAEQTKRIFNIVLGSIAAISLLVGGIGIMNIMLASVTERTREIGIRRALGATRTDIVIQFLVEALLLSLIGGLIGVGLGIAVPKVVTHLAGLVTIIQVDAIILAFSISLGTGIIFGLYPAIRAAALSPIEALRHE
jgi:putative ABC transport system permease protein